jgi:hypothetical protein
VCLNCDVHSLLHAVVDVTSTLMSRVVTAFTAKSGGG